MRNVLQLAERDPGAGAKQIASAQRHFQLQPYNCTWSFCIRDLTSARHHRHIVLMSRDPPEDWHLAMPTAAAIHSAGSAAT